MAALAPLLSVRTRVRRWQSPRRLWWRLQLPLDNCCRLVFTVIWCLVSPFKSSKFMQQPHDLECSLQGQRKENDLNATKVF